MSNNPSSTKKNKKDTNKKQGKEISFLIRNSIVEQTACWPHHNTT
jgi:hypothetical protein